ncbi:MAG TPA: hypothetical protein VII92_02795 [Anaerolineae bacterium]
MVDAGLSKVVLQAAASARQAIFRYNLGDDKKPDFLMKSGFLTPID